MLAMHASAGAVAPLRPTRCVPTRARAEVSSAAAVAKPRPARVAFASPIGLDARSSRTLRARAGNDPPGPLDGLADGISADKVKAAVEASRLASVNGQWGRPKASCARQAASASASARTCESQR